MAIGRKLYLGEGGMTKEIFQAAKYYMVAKTVFQKVGGTGSYGTLYT